MSGGRRSGRVRNARACPGPPGAVDARVRAVGSQPRVLVSAIPAAPAESAPRNLRRVIVPPSLPLPAHFSAKSVLSPAPRRRRPQKSTTSDRTYNFGRPAIPGNSADLPRNPATLQPASVPTGREAPSRQAEDRRAATCSYSTVSRTSSTVVMPWAALVSPSSLRGVMPAFLAAASISSVEAPRRISRRSCSSTSMISYTPIRPE
jgi:hypothetical protein